MNAAVRREPVGIRGQLTAAVAEHVRVARGKDDVSPSLREIRGQKMRIDSRRSGSLRLDGEEIRGGCVRDWLGPERKPAAERAQLRGETCDVGVAQHGYVGEPDAPVDNLATGAANCGSNR
jgi:hypothetical protein